MTVPDGFSEPSETMVAMRALVAEAVRLRHTLSRRAGLSDTELTALEHLVDTASTPTELARLLNVTTAASTGVVDRLERRGHVERRRHPTDRRRVEVHVTPEGRADLLTQLQPMLHGLTVLDETLSAAEQAAVIRYLDGARAAFAQVTDGSAEL
jgi:DNA-binding MarR family transcriptional regulator